MTADTQRTPTVPPRVFARTASQPSCTEEAKP
jgi:hypothetical protein